VPLNRQQRPPEESGSLRSQFDDPFEEEEDIGQYTGRTARDYAEAYREFDDDFEDESPRRWGGLILMVLALVAIAALAVGLIFWYQQQPGESAGGSDVPVVTAPDEPAKKQPEQAQEPSSSAPPQGKKLIYDRILGSGSSNESERIVPRQEAPRAPEQSSGEGNLDSLPLALPPPPQPESSLQPQQGQSPAASAATGLPSVSETQEAAAEQPAASAFSEQQQASEPETTSTGLDNPPVPRAKPRELVASIQTTPNDQFQPVIQPGPTDEAEAGGPIQLQPQRLQTLPANPQLSQQPPAQRQISSFGNPPEAPATQNQSRTVGGRAEDPLAGIRSPFQSAQQPAQQPAQQQQPQIASIPQPQPQPLQPQQQQSLQSFAPPPQQPAQSQASAPSTGGYVVQLAAYRSESEALQEYQQLRARHQNLVGNLPPAVQATNLGASGTFYRLGMGPMSSKQAATELCNKLIAAGERDCLVRRR
jgi:hypothetical protein